MVICLEQGANNLHMVQLMPVPPHHDMYMLGEEMTSVPYRDYFLCECTIAPHIYSRFHPLFCSGLGEL